MAETSARLLRLLSLLQARRDWTGTELAVRLGVTTRTIRHDVDRLRGLGYPVDARPGVAGGYRLGSGGALPPLLLDDEEAVAVAVGLRTAASGSVAGIEEASVRALAKLQQVLPSRLRPRVSAFQAYALPVPSRGPQVDPDVLTMIASACRDHERVRFDYRAHSGAPAGATRSRIAWCTTGSAGTWWPGIPTGTPGVPSASTGRATAVSRAALRAPRAAAPTRRSRRRWHAERARRPGGTGPR